MDFQQLSQGFGSGPIRTIFGVLCAVILALVGAIAYLYRQNQATQALLLAEKDSKAAYALQILPITQQLQGSISTLREMMGMIRAGDRHE